MFISQTETIFESFEIVALEPFFLDELVYDGLETWIRLIFIPLLFLKKIFPVFEHGLPFISY